jgi:uncharacterized protein (TIGR03790 family)
MKLKSTSILVLALALAAGIPARGADSGDQVVVVYNSRMPESKELAEYYAQRRHVPSSQVFGFDLTTAPEISRSEFRTSLQRPLAQLLNERKLWRMGSEVVRGTNGVAARLDWRVKSSKIRYAVLCYGVPYRITRDANLVEPGEDRMRPEFRRNEAAVDTELALLPCIELNLPLAGPLPNPLFGSTNPASFDPTNGVLLVTRLDGPSADIARGLVDKALQAEADGLWGRAYFDLRDIADPGYKVGDDWIRGAAEVCQRMGFETVVDHKPATFPPEFPMSQIAFYCGWYDENVSGPFTRPHVEFMPGAFAYHLHSYSAVDLRSATQHWVGPLLAKGATITMGCVDEPYLEGTPQVAVFASRFIGLGMTFGEAAYACQPVLSWQTTFVGDPLYRPFGKNPQQLHERLKQTHSPLLEWSDLQVVNLRLARGAPLAGAVAVLEGIDETRHSAVLTEKLADIYSQLGKPESAIETYRRALQLDPSPQQRVRLRITLGDKLIAISASEDKNKLNEAIDNDEALLRENPDYPNRLAVYRILSPLARKAGRREDADRYDALIQALTPPPPEANPAAVK